MLSQNGYQEFDIYIPCSSCLWNHKHFFILNGNKHITGVYVQQMTLSFATNDKK